MVLIGVALVTAAIGVDYVIETFGAGWLLGPLLAVAAFVLPLALAPLGPVFSWLRGLRDGSVARRRAEEMGFADDLNLLASLDDSSEN